MPLLWPNYLGEKRTTLCKAYWIKVWCYWEHFGDRKTLPHKTTQLKKHPCMTNMVEILLIFYLPTYLALMQRTRKHAKL